MQPEASHHVAGPTFSERQPDLVYRLRNGAYGVAVRDDLVLVVDAPEGRFLPGGACKAEESPLSALRREMTEETGYDILVAEELGTASQFIVARASGEPIEKRGHFLAVSLSAAPVAAPTESDHISRWVPIDDALGTLTEGSHAWAVRRVAQPD